MIVYLSRSLLDFASMMTLFAERRVEFISLTEKEAHGKELKNYAGLWEKLTLKDKRQAAGLLIEVVYATSEEVQIFWTI